MVGYTGSTLGITKGLIQLEANLNAGRRPIYDSIDSRLCTSTAIHYTVQKQEH